MTRVLLAAGVLFGLAGPVAAQTADLAPAQTTVSQTTPTSSKNISGVTVMGKKPGTPDPKEMICRREPVLGTLFPKEICARREELVERQRIDQDELRRNTQLRPWKDPGG